MIYMIPSQTTIFPNREKNERLFYDENSIFNSYRYFKVHKNIDFKSSKNEWLSQFSSTDERKEMIDLLLDNLIYMPQNSLENTISSINTKTDCLNYYVGLTDGARMDLFRFFHPNLYNFQISSEFEINNYKFETFLRKMKAVLSGQTLDSINIILIDEICASGLSFIRYENGTWKGKIKRAFDVFTSFSNTYSLKLSFKILTYYATQEGLDYLEKGVSSLLFSGNYNTDFCITGITILPKAKINNTQLQILMKHYWKNPINDYHYKIGGYDKPYLGFAQSQLLTVFDHNSPNNTLPIIWHSHPLFPRQPRHITTF